ncbi:vacuolar amino acid transporter 5 [Pelomyxa schiedti]|nr:vacuolar amino acid transporter 5 [Pelomyxa schiedti]
MADDVEPTSFHTSSRSSLDFGSIVVTHRPRRASYDSSPSSSPSSYSSHSRRGGGGGGGSHNRGSQTPGDDGEYLGRNAAIPLIKGTAAPDSSPFSRTGAAAVKMSTITSATATQAQAAPETLMGLDGGHGRCAGAIVITSSDQNSFDPGDETLQSSSSLSPRITNVNHDGEGDGKESRQGNDEGEVEIEGAGDGDDKKGASVISGISNISNTLLGCGMLGLGWAVAKAGLILGPCLILLFGAISVFSLELLHSCCTILEVKSPLVEHSDGNTLHTQMITYQTVAKRSIAWGNIIVDASIIGCCFGIITAYMLVLGQLIPDIIIAIFPSTEQVVSKQIVLPVVLLVLGALSFPKKLDSLRYTSLFALVCAFYIFSLVTVFAIWKPKLDGNIVWFSLTTETLGAIPIVVFAYCCHPNFFGVWNEMKKHNRNRNMRVVVWISCAIAFVCYQGLGICGYISSGTEIQPNILSALPADAISVIIARVLQAILVIFSYPVLLHPARASLDSLAFARWPEWRPLLRHACETLLLVIASFIIAFFVDDLDKVLGITGGTASTIICYVMPGLCYSRLSGPGWNATRILSVLLVVSGILFCGVCLAAIVYNIVSG